MLNVSRPLFLISCLFGVFGFSSQNSFLVTQTDFDSLTKSIFKGQDVAFNGSGSSTWATVNEYTAVFAPKKSDENVKLNFDEWKSLLNSKETFQDHGTERDGVSNCYRRFNWGNQIRTIFLSVTWLKNGNLRVSYTEILR